MKAEATRQASRIALESQERARHVFTSWGPRRIGSHRRKRCELLVKIIAGLADAGVGEERIIDGLSL
jgi:hypothetical protein